MSFHDILADVGRYYSDKVRTFGPTARGVDWNSPESQELRFEQLLKVCDLSKPFSINDYGCGYGALAEYMTRKGCAFRYCGFDISADMLSKAIELHREHSQCKFVREESDLTVMDLASEEGLLARIRNFTFRMSSVPPVISFLMAPREKTSCLILSSRFA
jgi:SAM-dependent methyltransferase